MNLGSKKAIESAPIPESGQALYWDDRLPGFGLRVTAKGARSFIAQGRVNRTVRRVTLGRYGVLMPDEARKRARAALVQMTDGEDPNQTKRREAALGTTLAQAAEDYCRNKRRRDGKALADRTQADIRRHVRGSFGDWQDLPLREITRDMVARRYGKLADASLAQANQAMRILAAIFRFTRATTKGPSGEYVLLDNPVDVILDAGLYRGDVPGRRTRIPMDKVGTFLAALDDARTSPDSHPGIVIKASAAMALMLTGLRLADLLERRWVDVDLDDGTLHVADTKHRSPRTFPIADQVVEVLRDLRPLTGSGDFPFAALFSGARQGHIREIRDGMAPGCNAIGMHITPHDLRRTWIDGVNAVGVDPLAAELLANRKGAQFTALSTRMEHYDDTIDLTRYRPEAQRLADWFTDQAAKARSPQDGRPT
ncbi:hypothetical protein M911_13835 [Ectothiorhodospira haloalkaliphila]|uniref:Tyr recombinase domain-containing protein n=1 Tax=Ectothiorhodospira haloalkaliphila TaxID=421628 RepID=W8LAC5_9GAMM|nr:integrase family protein [Ectothiorhodospira haloalkaliphila]AHK80770.1 hypothetical protein M911_13835 [Ectothiorhodospira haloalkaliphila]